jgi:hypothetical protein
MPELMIYGDVTDYNVSAFPAPPGADQLVLFTFDSTPLLLGTRDSTGTYAGIWTGGFPPQETISGNAFFPEYEGLSYWRSVSGSVADTIDFAIVEVSGSTVTPISNVISVTYHAVDDPVPGIALLRTPATVVTIGTHGEDPINHTRYLDIGAEARVSPDSRIPIMWYRWFTGGDPQHPNPDGSFPAGTTEITDYTPPLGPRQRTLVQGPVPNGTYQFACIAYQPMFWGAGSPYLISVTSDWAVREFLSDLGYWTVGMPPTAGNVSVGQRQAGVRRLSQRHS